MPLKCTWIPLALQTCSPFLLYPVCRGPQWWCSFCCWWWWWGCWCCCFVGWVGCFCGTYVAVGLMPSWEIGMPEEPSWRVKVLVLMLTSYRTHQHYKSSNQTFPPPPYWHYPQFPKPPLTPHCQSKAWSTCTLFGKYSDGGAKTPPTSLHPICSPILPYTAVPSR